MIVHQLDLLTPAELIILEEHLKLGLGHLKKHLSKNQLDQILASLTLNQTQISKIGRSGVEIMGNLSLALNSIITATFGAWMGYFAFWGFSIASFRLFGFIVALAAGIGAVIGFQSVYSAKQQAKDAINNQVLHVLQIEILKRIGQKRKEESDTIYQELDHLLADLSQGTSFAGKLSVLHLTDKSRGEIFEWAEKVAVMGKEKLEGYFSGLVPAKCTEEWMEIQGEFRQNLVGFFEKQGELDTIHDGAEKSVRKGLDPSLKKLISVSPAESVAPVSWVRRNARSLILGLTPTLLGGFSSLSVYLGGVPSILKNFGHEKWFAFFTTREAKLVEFTLALLITLYFGFSFVFSNRKAFHRAQELEKTNKTIVQMESSLTLLDADLIKLKELKKSSLQLMRFFKITEVVGAGTGSKSRR